MPKVLTDHIQIRVRPKQVAFWKAVAARQEVTLSQLVREAADTYARLQLATEMGPGEDNPLIEAGR